MILRYEGELKQCDLIFVARYISSDLIAHCATVSGDFQYIPVGRANRVDGDVEDYTKQEIWLDRYKVLSVIKGIGVDEGSVCPLVYTRVPVSISAELGRGQNIKRAVVRDSDANRLVKGQLVVVAVRKFGSTNEITSKNVATLGVRFSVALEQRFIEAAKKHQK